MLYTKTGATKEAIKVIVVPQNLQEYINAEVLTHTQKSLGHYSIGCYHIKEGKSSYSPALL